MESSSSGPKDYQLAMQRLMPYMSQDLRNDPQGMEAILLFFKVGGDKLARIAIDAFNQTRRLENVKAHRLRLKAAMMDELSDDADKDDDEDGDNGDDDVPEVSDDEADDDGTDF